MSSEPTIDAILGLRLGSREVGMAVLEGGELVDWGVMGFRRRKQEVCAEQFGWRLQELLLRYQPNVVAIESPAPMRCASSPGLCTITAQSRSIAEEAGLGFWSFCPSAIRAGICGTVRATWPQVAEQVTARYPHLGQHRACASVWRESYWAPMFTAVAVAFVCSRALGATGSGPAAA